MLAFRPLAASLIILLSLVFCIGCDEEPTTECKDRSYPYCSSVSELVECVGESELTSECAAGMHCASFYDAANTSFSRCVPLEAEACDVESYLPRCQSTQQIRTCQAPWEHPAAGNTVVIECGEGLSCRQGNTRDACVPADSEPCDPATFAGACDGASPVYCDEVLGFTQRQAACEADLVCKVGAMGAKCVEPEAEPCDVSTYVSACVGESRVYCSSFSGFTRTWPCEANERCRESEWGGACFGPDQPDCEPALFEPRCASDTELVFCRSGYEVEEVRPCNEGDRCRIGTQGAVCAAPEAEPCDDVQWESRCAGEGYDICATSTGFTLRIDCSEGELCRQTGHGPQCLGADEVPCDFESFASSCEGDMATACDFFTGYTYSDRCGESERCVLDTYCLGHYCGAQASCVDRSLPSCDAPSTTSCDGEAIKLCFGGYEFTYSCAEGQECISEGAAWHCVEADAASCDASYLSQCEGDLLHTCFAGREITRDCAAESKTCSEGACW